MPEHNLKMMSILMHSTLLMCYLLSFMTTIHGQAARDFMIMDITSPLQESTEQKTQDSMLEETSAPDHAQESTGKETRDFTLMETTTANPLEESTGKETQNFTLMDITTPDTLKESIALCTSPPHLPFGQVSEEYFGINAFEPGASVYYECLPGYLHVPGIERKVTCLENAAWSVPDQFCRPNFCTDPPQIQNGQLREAALKKKTFAVNERVSYLCRPGYIRIPGTIATATCLSDNTWSTPNEFCTRRSCGFPGEVSNGEIEAKDFLFGSRVTYVCNPGYKMTSRRNYRDCQADGTWSNTLPECEALSCPSPPSINNGLYYPTKDEYGYFDSVTYRCIYESMALIGEQFLTCNINGEWSPEPPECRVVQCPNPNVPNAVKLTGTTGPYFLNSAVRFMCSDGYELKGANFVKCTQNSVWQPELPECIGYCQLYHRYFPNMIVFSKEGRFIHGTSLTFECKEGYELQPGANENITCKGIKWVNVNSCSRISCGDPGPIPNADMQPGDYLFGDVIHYTCHRGYNMKASNSRKCMEDGTWSLPVPECKVVNCGTPIKYDNAEFEAKNFLYKSEVIYTCKKGYKMELQNISRRCGASGKWLGRGPVCKVQTCSPPQDLLDGSYSPRKTSYDYLESVTYKCNKKNIVGEQTIFCSEDGNWTHGAPECKAVCISPPTLGYGELEEEFTHQNVFKISASVQYKCRPGFVPATENRNVVCLDNLEWSEPEIFCKPRLCEKPEDIEHGTMLYENLSFGSTVNYTCNSGYTMISKTNFRQCQEDGTWSGKTPECKESVCDKMWALQEEVRKCTSTPDEWIKYLQVQYLYLQIENQKLDIELKKKQLMNS